MIDFLKRYLSHALVATKLATAHALVLPEYLSRPLVQLLLLALLQMTFELSEAIRVAISLHLGHCGHYLFSVRWVDTFASVEERTLGLQRCGNSSWGLS